MLPAESAEEAAAPGWPPAHTRSPLNPAEVTGADESSCCSLPAEAPAGPSRAPPPHAGPAGPAAPAAPAGPGGHRTQTLQSSSWAQNRVQPLTAGVQTAGGKTCRRDTPGSGTSSSPHTPVAAASHRGAHRRSPASPEQPVHPDYNLSPSGSTHLNLCPPPPPPPPPPWWSAARQRFLWEEEGTVKRIGCWG